MASRCLCLRVLPCIVLTAAACSSDGGEAAAPSGTGGTGGTSSVGDADLPYAPCSAETSVEGFSIEFAVDHTTLQGKVFDAVDPTHVPTELASEGACRLLSPPTLLCDPGCATSTEVCAPGNQCIPVPVGHGVGTVSVSGLVRAVEMTPNAATAVYRPPPPALPHPGFQPGADLRLSATGGDYSPFELRGWGIAVLEAPPEPITVTAGQPAAVRWAPPAGPSPTRVHVQLDINNHGSTNTSIECEFEDTGVGEIPASLIDGLIARGTSGFPSIILTRRTASSTSIEPGCVQFLVTSTLELDAALTGLTSCDIDAECPEGQTCKPIERFCE